LPLRQAGRDDDLEALMGFVNHGPGGTGELVI
jgi:hypothetical protein